MKKILCFISVLCCIVGYTFAQNSKAVIPLLNAYDFLFFNRINDQYADSSKRAALFKEAQATASAIQKDTALQQNFKPLYTRYYAEYYYLAMLVQLDKIESFTQLLPVLDTAVNWYKNNLYVNADSAAINKLKKSAGVREASVTYDNSELYDALIDIYNSTLLDALKQQLQEYAATNRYDAETVDKIFALHKFHNETYQQEDFSGDTTFQAMLEIRSYFKVLQQAKERNCDSLIYYYTYYKLLSKFAGNVMKNVPLLDDTIANCNEDSAYVANIENELSAQFAPLARAGGGFSMPAFPWPPPVPSSRSQPLKFKSPNIQTLEDANEQLLSALATANYNPPAYYYVPGGFALVTPLEQIATGGKPKGDPPRWSVKVQLSDEFSFMNYLKALFVGLKGYYRVMAFVVTDQPLSFTPSATASQVLNIQGGIDRLPPEIGYQPFTANHRCTVLIYEFEKEGGSNVTNFIQPGRYSVQTHLQQTQVWQKLF